MICGHSTCTRAARPTAERRSVEHVVRTKTITSPGGAAAPLLRARLGADWMFGNKRPHELLAINHMRYVTMSKQYHIIIRLSMPMRTSSAERSLAPARPSAGRRPLSRRAKLFVTKIFSHLKGCRWLFFSCRSLPPRARANSFHRRIFH